MSVFDRALDRVETNIHKEHNCIPFSFPRFNNFLPGIEQKKYYIVTANSGVGKTQITDHMFWYTPYEFVKDNETDIKLKFFYYSLEMDKESKMLQMIARRLFMKYGIRTNVMAMQSIGKNRCSEELYEKMKECREYCEGLEDITFIHADQINPYGIYKEVKEWAEKNGTVHTKIEKRKNKQGKLEDVEFFDYYTPNDENVYPIVITDHLAELIPEKGMNLKATIEKHSNNMKLLRNNFGITCVDVQQQMASKEGVEHAKFNKHEPSLDGLGESKLTQRKANIILGLFAPSRHEITDYKGYDMTKMQDHFRWMMVLKNRNGISNVSTPLFYDGAVNVFKEMPKKDSPKLSLAYERACRLVLESML